MNRFKFLFQKSLFYYAWQEFLVRYRFKFVLPLVTETVLDGIRLDLSPLSLKVRNRILMGIYEAHEKRMCYEFLAPTDSVMELGGAIGFIGLVCQKKIGIQKYYVFEANPKTLEMLRRNYQLNGLTPLAWNLALGPENGSIELDVASDFWENSVVARSPRPGPRSTVRVQSASFTSLLREVPNPVNVLIIDVEGAEQFIDPTDIPTSVDKIIIEIHPTVLGPEKTYDLIGRLIQCGFKVAQEENATFAFVRTERTAPASRSRRILEGTPTALATHR